MDRQTLIAFRTALRRKDVSLRKLADLSGIPKATLHDMSKDDWGETLFERGESLKCALTDLGLMPEAAKLQGAG